MSPDPARSIAILDAVRGKSVRVHCLTNSVARTFTANVLLAIGAVPSMSHDASEIGDFMAGADALLVNLGTLDPAMRAAIAAALPVTVARDLPWVLDPVFADRSQLRQALAAELLARRPTALRLNEAEAAALGSKRLKAARSTGVIVALSGKIDRVCAERRTCDVDLGHPLMRRVTAMGCALGAVIAAFIAASEDRFAAVCAAVHVFSAAGSLAGAGARGPGGFVPAFLDGLFSLDAASLAAVRKDR